MEAECAIDQREIRSAGETGLVPWWSFTKTVLAATALRLVETGVLPRAGAPGSAAFELPGWNFVGVVSPSVSGRASAPPLPRASGGRHRSS